MSRNETAKFKQTEQNNNQRLTALVLLPFSASSGNNTLFVCIVNAFGGQAARGQSQLLDKENHPTRNQRSNHYKWEKHAADPQQRLSVNDFKNVICKSKILPKLY